MVNNTRGNKAFKSGRMREKDNIYITSFITVPHSEHWNYQKTSSARVEHSSLSKCLITNLEDSIVVNHCN